MKIAVTGASGFVGRKLVKRWSDAGHQVIALGRNLGRLTEAFGDRVVCRETDYGLDSLHASLPGADVVVNLAAERVIDPSDGLRRIFEVNVHLSENVFRAAGECSVKRLIHASSISVFSSRWEKPIDEQALPNPGNIYGVSKLASEALANLYARKYSTPVSILRFATIFGWGDIHGAHFAINTFIRRALDKEFLEVSGNGKGERDLIFIQDVLNAIDAAVQPEKPTGLFHIGGGKLYSILEMAETVNEVFENQGNLMVSNGPQAGPDRVLLDGSKAESQLNWKRGWNLRSGLMAMKDELMNGKNSL